MKKIICSIFPALVLTGCLSAAKVSPLASTHPANPEATPASYPPLTPFLMADTNLVGMTTPSTNAPEMNHENHDAKPASKPEHKHDHD